MGALLLALGAACLPFLWTYSEELAFTALRSNDELALLRTLEGLLSPTWTTGYFRQFNAFGYGFFWWTVLLLAAIPSKVLGSEQGLILTIRSLSLASSLAGFWFGYQAIRPVAIQRPALWIPGLLLACLCFLSGQNFTNATYVHPETMYCGFLMLAFWQLSRAGGSYSRSFYWSLVWWTIAVSIKTLAALFGVVYIVYVWCGDRPTRAQLLRAAGLLAGTGLAVNPWLLHPALARPALATMYSQSSVTRLGWPELHHIWTLEESLAFFSNSYLDIAFLLTLFGLALLSMVPGLQPNRAEYRKSATFRLLAMAFIGVTTYTAFSIFYAWLPAHYGIFLLYLVPPLGALTIQRLSSVVACAQSPRLRNRTTLSSLAAVAICALAVISQRQSLDVAAQALLHPRGGETHLLRYQAIEAVRTILEQHSEPLQFVGVAHDLAVPRVRGERISYWHLNSLPDHLVARSDLLIFWKRDYAYEMKYQNREPADPSAFDVYRAIRDGRSFAHEGGLFAFAKLLEDQELEVYQRTAVARVIGEAESPTHGPAKALDGSTAPDDFWEVKGAFPHDLTIRWASRRNSLSYTLAAGELSTRMPRSWIVERSPDGEEWTTLGEEYNVEPWSPGEVRRVALRETRSSGAYRFSFLAGHDSDLLRIYEITLGHDQSPDERQPPPDSE